VLRAALVVLLVILSQAQAACATVSIVQRVSAVSWDSPTTQQVDELASQAVPFADPAAETAACARTAAVRAGRLTAPDVRSPGQDPILGSGITRSPPAA
jgi:hypothetical protein